MTDVLIDSYSETNFDDYAYTNDTLEQDGQSFMTPNDVQYKLTKAKFYINKNNWTVEGTITARLYAHSGTFGVDGVPTGDALAISDPVTIASLPSGWNLVEFTFSGAQQYLMEKNTPYIITACNTLYVHYSYLWLFGRDSSSPTHNGNYVYNSMGGWQYSTSIDAIFYVYGEVYIEEKTINFGIDVLIAPRPIVKPKCSACHIHDAHFMIRISNQFLCDYCFHGQPVNGKIYQTWDYSKSVFQ